MNTDAKHKYLREVLAVLSIIALWQLFTGPDTFIPAPLTVLDTFIAQIQQSSIQKYALETTYRVYISAFIALVIGVIIGTLDYFSESFSDVVNSLFYPTQFVSEAVLTLLAITLIGLSPLIIYIITVIAILPDIFVVVQIALENLDERLMEFGKVHSESKINLFRHIVIPQILPYILSGFLRAHATAWDIVATVEIFLIAGGLGQLSQNYYNMLDLPGLFSVVAIILVLGLSSDRFFRIVKKKIDRRYMHADYENSRLV